MAASLVWNKLQMAAKRADFQRIQAFIDSEVLRYSDPLTPQQTGNLIRSGRLGTVIGSGEIKYTAPYAHMQYYYTKKSRSYDRRRGGRWFERMKSAHKKDILAGVREYYDTIHY